MTYDPKIFIRDYGAPTYRLLAFSGGFSLGMVLPTVRRTLFLRIDAPSVGEQYVRLSGDMQSGSDLLELSGAGNDLLVLDTTDAFRLFGPDSGLIYSIVEPVTVGAFALTGHAMVAKRHLVLRASPGVFALTGRAIDARRDLILHLATTAFALTGSAANVQLGKIFNVDRGIFVLAGAAARLNKIFSLRANASTFTVSTSSTRFISAKVMRTNAATFTVVGKTVDLSTEFALGLSGDMQSGSDAQLLSGDMQSGSDLLIISKEGL